MRIVLILTSALIIYAQAAPQINVSPRNWRVIINRGQDQSPNIRGSQRQNNGRGRQALAQYRQPDNQEQQTLDNNQAVWGMCWYPLNKVARDSSSRGPAPPPQYHNHGMHHHHNGDYHHDQWNGHGHRPPPSHSHHHGPPPPSHHHHDYHHHHHHHAPPPPPPRPMHRPHKGMDYPLEICQEPSETSTPSGQDTHSNPASSAPLISTPETPKNDGVETVTQNTITEDSGTSTTEFDWNNYFIEETPDNTEGTPDNTDGIGLIDIRTGGVAKPK